ncbi:putative Uncharacterized 14.6 kDa protein in sodA1 3'region [Verrucomicrobia bacterium]|nr:putative Uncharacterized 14.6 kDa protein in sodA1 3'region [Verrucomicrobiota bacterium]
MSASALKKRILIVDDDPDLLDLFATLLRDAGYAVDAAPHARAAQSAIGRATPDLILADMRMPVMDGLALVRLLKAQRDTCHIPVVALTGCDTPRVRESAFEAGYDDFLAKPIDACAFPGQIADLLRQHSHESPPPGLASPNAEAISR